MSIINGVRIRRKDFGQMLKIGFGIIVDIFLATSMYNTDNKSNRILYGIMLVPFTLIIVSGIKTRKKLKKIYAMDSLLTSAQVTEVRLSDMAEALGMKEKKLKKILAKAYKKKQIQNCELYLEGDAKLVMIFDVETAEAEIECPSCGKVFTAKSYGTARCPECASIINI